MNRYNPFFNLHKGLRVLLNNTSLLLQQTDFTVAAEEEQAVNRVSFILLLFEQYQQAKDAFILPVITAHEPCVADLLQRMHEEGCQVVKKLQAVVLSFGTALQPLEKLVAGKILLVHFNRLCQFKILHMARLERLANTLLWRHYSDGELQELAITIIHSAGAAITPYGKWLICRLDNAGKKCCFEAAKGAAPAMEFHTPINTAEDALNSARLNLLQKVLSAGRILAN